MGEGFLTRRGKSVKGDAEASHVLAGKTFSSKVAGIGVTGTMPNRGAVVITPSTSNQTIQAGYHNGNGYVKGDPNLVPENIAKGKSIFGVSGNFSHADILYKGMASVWGNYPNTGASLWQQGYVEVPGYDFYVNEWYIGWDGPYGNARWSAVTKNRITLPANVRVMLITRAEVGICKIKIVLSTTNKTGDKDTGVTYGTTEYNVPEGTSFAVYALNNAAGNYYLRIHTEMAVRIGFVAYM